MYFAPSRFFLCFCLLGFSLTAAPKPLNSPVQLQERYAAVAEKSLPAVVTIHAFKDSNSKNVGSGFFVSKDGYIVTNYHVIAWADTLVVKLADGTIKQAKIIGCSEAVDLAVLKIESTMPLPYLTFTDTRKVKVGHYAIAIGSPFSLSQTMTVGIVSYKGRKLGLNYKEDYIQTDASINPGNSGGPLLDISGNVIGVNDCIIAPPNAYLPKGSVGVGFAIDGNLAHRVVKKIIGSAHAGKAFAGIQLKYDSGTSGVRIVQIQKGSPAAAAGLKAGDYLLQIDNQVVNSVPAAYSVITRCYQPGDKAYFVIRRQGKVWKALLTFGKQK